ncbi:hypothetical protein VQY18_01930 [Mycoplasma feriruminatoris]|uniref:Uncharacterized protein n=1 Tax=Mycoplasma feriruminatoris TaxID=1179777 RepID=A0A654IMF1_9MOLU|nr:hypothetical protein MF5583_00391 [Mycoplasma feriruminatoris]
MKWKNENIDNYLTYYEQRDIEVKALLKGYYSVDDYLEKNGLPKELQKRVEEAIKREQAKRKANREALFGKRT